MTRIGRSENWAHSRAHWGLSAAGAMIRPAADPAGAPEDVAAGDRLRGLAQPHVVGQQEPPGLQEPLHALALIGIERALQPLSAGLLLGGPERLLDDPLELRLLVRRAGPQRRVVPPRLRAPTGTALSRLSTSSSRFAGSSR